jgi:hypothetical protein
MHPFDRSSLQELLLALGEYLRTDGHEFSIIVVGGASLALLGLVSRTTTDVDVLALVGGEEEAREFRSADPLPTSLVEAAKRVARDYGLLDDWLNATVAGQWELGPPPGLNEEIEWRRFAGLEVGFVGRRALIALKLFAAVDQGPQSVHSQDLVALRPTSGELVDAAEWVREQDASEGFPRLVWEAIEDVREAIRRDSTPG